MRILKFGGSSLADASSIRKVAEIVAGSARKNGEIAVVVSARHGVTNRLNDICGLIGSEPGSCENEISKIEREHLSAVRELIPVTGQPQVMAEIIALCNQLDEVVRGATLTGEITSRTRDLVLSFGERLSAWLMYNVLSLYEPHLFFTDSRLIIRTDACYGNAKVLFGQTSPLVREHFSAKRGLHVVTGYIGSTSDNQTTTLGRNGSDYTASILGAALDAEMIEIWSDTDGVMTADPRYVDGAKNIPQLTYNEAMELSHFGAKIIFPASLHPAMVKGIPIEVKNTFNPDHRGTLISSRKSAGNGFFKGISSLQNVSLINLEGSGMVGVTGVASRMFSVLSAEKINVILISQASSEHSICIAIKDEESETAKKLLHQCFSSELELGLISSIDSQPGQAVIAVVGENMRNMPGVAARVFAPLGRNGINIKAISQGSSELNISFVIGANDLKKALRVLHQSLFENELRQVHLHIAGTGLVGSRLLELIHEKNKYLADKNIDLRLCSVINSRSMLQNIERQESSAWKSLFGKSGKKADFRDFVDAIVSGNVENTIFVDVTPSEEPVNYYSKLLSSNISIVSANKRANSGDLGLYRSIHSNTRKRNISFNYETNVGAGLPVINTVRNILAGGDRIIKIECVISGTINWLLNNYNATGTFASLVKQAKQLGLTEPDPYEDLSGNDVARKCLILARECGMEMEPGQVISERLIPPDFPGHPKGELLYTTLEKCEPWYREKYLKAAAGNKILKYMAIIEEGNVRTGLGEIAESHPFYGLVGAENCIVFNTSFYDVFPMVIRGPGAGADVTAAGILADIVRIAEQVRQ